MTGAEHKQTAIEPRKPLWVRVLPLLLVVAAFAAVFIFGLDEFLSFEMLKNHRKTVMEWYVDNHFVAIISMILIYALVVAL